jgi:hypothetical protein
MGSPQGRRLDGRNGEIWRQHVSGVTQEALAEKYEISHQRVSQIIAQVRESIPPEDKDKVRQEHLELLRGLRVELTKLVDAGPIPAYSNGRPIVLENGAVAQDHSGRLAAMDRLQRMLERESKLLGIDAPTKLDATMTLSESDAAKALAAEAAERLARFSGDGE